MSVSLKTGVDNVVWPLVPRINIHWALTSAGVSPGTSLHTHAHFPDCLADLVICVGENDPGPTAVCLSSTQSHLSPSQEQSFMHEQATDPLNLASPRNGNALAIQPSVRMIFNATACAASSSASLRFLSWSSSDFNLFSSSYSPYASLLLLLFAYIFWLSSRI